MLCLLRLSVRNSPLSAAIGRHRGIAAEIAFRRFHLDHLGAQVGQHLAAIGAGDDLAELQYPDAFERIRHFTAQVRAR